MRIHERVFVVQEAESQIGIAINELVTKHDLTFAETIQILCSCIASNTKYMIREERHGDQNIPGGSAPEEDA